MYVWVPNKFNQSINANISDFMKIEGACHPVISECPFKQ